MLRPLFRLTPLLVACGCSTGTLTPYDAGFDRGTPDASAPDTSVPDTSVPDSGRDTGSDTSPVMDAGAPVLMGRRSFVVTSTLTLHADGGSLPTGAPQSHAFTVVADADRLTAFVGAGGSATSRPLELTPTGFSILGRFSISLPGCSSSVSYDNLTLTLGAGGELAGIASGRVGWPSGTDVGNTFAASMSLTAVNDTEAPVFGAASVAADRTDPFSSFTLTATEPLPPDVRPVLIGQNGDFAFVPSTTEGFVITFNQPKLPRYSEQYRVALDGVVDFAGNAARTGSTSGGDIRFTTRAAPPLAAEDGFESATGASLGGAQVMSATGSPVIAGARSLYIPATSGSSTPASVLQQTQLALRLPLAPGDTVVRFSYREVNPNTFGGTSVVIASPGGTIAATALSSSPAGTTTSAMIGQTEVQLGPLMTAEIPLPPDAATEIVIARIVRGITCSGLPVPPVAGLIIDDLRAE